MFETLISMALFILLFAGNVWMIKTVARRNATINELKADIESLEFKMQQDRAGLEAALEYRTHVHQNDMRRASKQIADMRIKLNEHFNLMCSAYNRIADMEDGRALPNYSTTQARDKAMDAMQELYQTKRSFANWTQDELKAADDKYWASLKK